MNTYTAINMYNMLLMLLCDMVSTEMEWHGIEASESHTASNANQKPNPNPLNAGNVTHTHAHIVCG